MRGEDAKTNIEVILEPENDSEVTPLGIKGIGEPGNVGMNAAVANAVFHATGKRIAIFKFAWRSCSDD